MKTRKFNGETFGLFGTFKKKAKAQQMARGIRIQGFGARVVKVKQGHAVYKSR